MTVFVWLWQGLCSNFSKNVGISMKTLGNTEHKSFNVELSVHLPLKTKLVDLGSA